MHKSQQFTLFILAAGIAIGAVLITHGFLTLDEWVISEGVGILVFSLIGVMIMFLFRE